jgi:hypothetical protein
VRYRGFQKVSTGQWLTALFTTEGATFSASASSQEADFATALGINANDVSATDADADPRTGTLLALPVSSDAGIRADYAAASDDAARIVILAQQTGLS